MDHDAGKDVWISTQQILQCNEPLQVVNDPFSKGALVAGRRSRRPSVDDRTLNEASQIRQERIGFFFFNAPGSQVCKIALNDNEGNSTELIDGRFLGSQDCRNHDNANKNAE